MPNKKTKKRKKTSKKKQLQRINILIAVLFSVVLLGLIAACIYIVILKNTPTTETSDFYNVSPDAGNPITSLFISESEYTDIIDSHKEIENHLNIYYNGSILPYDYNEKYYLIPQTYSDSYLGNLYIPGYTIGIIESTTPKNDIIKDNSVLTTVAYNNKSYKFISLKFTTLPVLSINGDVLTVFDNISNDKVDINSYSASYHIRGQSSRETQLPGFKVNLFDENGKEYKTSLLGLPSDDDWILRTFQEDKTFIREPLGYDLWSNLSPHSVDSKHVELFIDGVYYGIYTLGEAKNSKSYDVSKNSSIFISIREWPKESYDDLFSENPTLKDNIIGDFEIKGNYSDNQKINVLKTLLYDIGLVNEPSSSEALQYNYDNLASYSLFLNLTAALDNRFKNINLLLTEKEGVFTVEEYPWDLDLTQYAYYKYINKSELFQNLFLPTDLPDNFETMIKEKYIAAKNDFYNESTLYRKIDELSQNLLSSGAVRRYPSDDYDYQQEIQKLKDFYKTRITELDDLYLK